MTHVDGSGLLHAIDRDGYVHFVRLRIARQRRRFVGGREKQFSRIGFEIELLFDVDRVRQAVDVDAGRRIDEKRRAAVGRDAERTKTRKRCELVGPGARGIDDNGRLEFAGRRAHDPVRGFFLQRRHARIGDENAAARAELAQISLMQGMDVDVGGVGLEDGSGRVTVAQQRANLLRFVCIDRARIRRNVGQREERAQFRQLVVSGDVKRSARAHQRVLDEAVRRRIEEFAAGAAERAHDGVAIGLGKKRGRTARGVVARLGFAFE